MAQVENAGAGKVDLKVIESELDKNEKLTPEEERALLESEPAPADYANGDPAGDSQEWLKEQKDGKEEPPKGEKEPEGKAEKAKEEPPLEDTKVDMLKIEEMLAQPEGKEDLSNMTKREQAYYWRMRKEQRRAAKAEEDRDSARFELAKIKKAPDAAEKKEKDAPAKEPEPEDDDPFKGKDPTDFLTVADAEKILAKAIKVRDKAAESKPKAETAGIMENPIVASYVKRCNEEMESSVPDYNEVMELTEEIIATNPDHQKKVAESLLSGGNPARTMYDLIKADPDFAKLLPAAQVRALARKNKKSDEGKPGAPEKEKSAEEQKKEAQAREVEKRLENNTNKPKTSGHAEGKDKAEGGDYSMEQIAQMSDSEFRALPKKTREKYLQMYG